LTLPKKLDLRKTKLFSIGPVVFAPHTQKYATEYDIHVTDAHFLDDEEIKEQSNYDISTRSNNLEICDGLQQSSAL
jgi:hypothetical protein